MKIAVPTRNNHIDDHFGQSEYFTVYTVSGNNKIETRELIESSQGCGCRSNLVSVLRDLGVKVMLAGNLGEGAFNKLISSGIKVIRGCHGITDELVEKYLKGEIRDQEIHCLQHRHQHRAWDRCGH